MIMTVRQLYEQGCALVYEIPDDDDDLKDSFPAILNQLVAVCLPYEQNFRQSRGEPVPALPPLYTSADDESELPFVDEITRLALPYGVQSKFLEADDDKKAEAVLAYNKMMDALNTLTPGVETEMGGDETT